MSESDNSNKMLAAPRSRAERSAGATADSGKDISLTSFELFVPRPRALIFGSRHDSAFIMRCMTDIAGAGAEHSRMEKKQRQEGGEGGEVQQALQTTEYSWADLPASLLLKMFEILSMLPDGRAIVSTSRAKFPQTGSRAPWPL